jgi:hypothetical protein
VGLNIRPVPVPGLAFGWEIRRAATPDATDESEVSWRYSWERPLEQAGALSLGVTAGGAIGLFHSSLSQHVTSFLAVSLGKAASAWTSEVRLSPELGFDAFAGRWTVAATPEWKTETLLSEPAARLRSALNLRLGYRLAPERKPSLALAVEWKIVPVL